MTFNYLGRETRIVVDLAGDFDRQFRGRPRLEGSESCVSTSANGEEGFKDLCRGKRFIIMPEFSILI